MKKKAARKQQEANIRRKKEEKTRAEQHQQFAAADYYEPPRASGQTLVKSAAGTASNQERTFVKKPVGKRTKINASTACSQEQTSLKQQEGKQKTAPLPGRKRGDNLNDRETYADVTRQASSQRPGQRGGRKNISRGRYDEQTLYIGQNYNNRPYNDHFFNSSAFSDSF